MTKAEHKEYIKVYMRRWRKLHPKQNYSAVKSWRKKLRENLGEDAFKEWQRGEYRKYRDRILSGQKERLAQKSPELLRQERKEYWQSYKAKNGDQIKAYRRDYYSRNRERTLERKRNSRNANPERTKIEWSKRASIRRARKRAATIGDLTDIAKVYERAKWWRQWFTVEVDHTISLARGGAHEAKNLQIIYDFENRRKYARSDYKPKVVFL